MDNLSNNNSNISPENISQLSNVVQTNISFNSNTTAEQVALLALLEKIDESACSTQQGDQTETTEQAEKPEAGEFTMGSINADAEQNSSMGQGSEKGPDEEQDIPSDDSTTTTTTTTTVVSGQTTDQTILNANKKTDGVVTSNTTTATQQVASIEHKEDAKIGTQNALNTDLVSQRLSQVITQIQGDSLGISKQATDLALSHIQNAKTLVERLSNLQDLGGATQAAANLKLQIHQQLTLGFQAILAEPFSNIKRFNQFVDATFPNMSATQKIIMHTALEHMKSDVKQFFGSHFRPDFSKNTSTVLDTTPSAMELSYAIGSFMASTMQSEVYMMEYVSANTQDSIQINIDSIMTQQDIFGMVENEMAQMDAQIAQLEKKEKQEQIIGIGVQAVLATIFLVLAAVEFGANPFMDAMCVMSMMSLSLSVAAMKTGNSKLTQDTPIGQLVGQIAVGLQKSFGISQTEAMLISAVLVAVMFAAVGGAAMSSEDIMAVMGKEAFASTSEAASFAAKASVAGFAFTGVWTDAAAYIIQANPNMSQNSQLALTISLAALGMIFSGFAGYSMAAKTAAGSIESSEASIEKAAETAETEAAEASLAKPEGEKSLSQKGYESISKTIIKAATVAKDTAKENSTEGTNPIESIEGPNLEENTPSPPINEEEEDVDDSRDSITATISKEDAENIKTSGLSSMESGAAVDATKTAKVSSRAGITIGGKLYISVAALEDAALLMQTVSAANQAGYGIETGLILDQLSKSVNILASQEATIDVLKNSAAAIQETSNAANQAYASMVNDLTQIMGTTESQAAAGVATEAEGLS